MKLDSIGYQNFSVKNRNVTIPKPLLDYIKEERGKLPIGIIFEYSRDKITGHFVYDETPQKEYVQLKFYGTNNISYSFLMPEPFKIFVDKLPINPRTIATKHPKKYAKLFVPSNATKIVWFVDETFVLDSWNTTLHNSSKPKRKKFVKKGSDNYNISSDKKIVRPKIKRID